MSTSMRTYRYPDPAESISQVGIRGSGLSDVEWLEQEKAVVDLFAEQLRTLDRRRTFLDFGSGEGRLIPLFSGLFPRITSYDVDPIRLGRQRAMLIAEPPAAEVESVTSFEPDARSGGYDAAVCSHVIQHVPVHDTEQIMAQLATAVRPGGLLLILTTLGGWEGTQMRFAVDSIAGDGSLVEAVVSGDEFDRTCRRNRPGELPVRFFRVADLEALVARHRFAPLFSCGFHGSPGMVGPIPPDDSARRPELKHCRDVAIAAVRTGG